MDDLPLPILDTFKDRHLEFDMLVTSEVDAISARDGGDNLAMPVDQAPSDVPSDSLPMVIDLRTIRGAPIL